MAAASQEGRGTAARANGAPSPSGTPGSGDGGGAATAPPETAQDCSNRASWAWNTVLVSSSVTALRAASGVAPPALACSIWVTASLTWGAGKDGAAAAGPASSGVPAG